MPVLTAPATFTHEAGPNRFTSLATPSKGSTESSVWKVEIPPMTPATPHSLTSEEVFVILEGSAVARLDGVDCVANIGDAVVVPAGVLIEWSNPGPDMLRMLCVLPVGGQARLADGTTFTPPWAL
jgi:mannose-6-phosphate isomerase-like protein (cupin superfamily)